MLSWNIFRRNPYNIINKEMNDMTSLLGLLDSSFPFFFLDSLNRRVCLEDSSGFFSVLM